VGSPASRSSGVHPPSGPMSTTGRSSVGGAPAASASAAPGRAATESKPAIGATSGSHVRRHCMAAWRAMVRHRSTRRSARPGSHRATDRPATNGTIRSTPSSVSFCTTNSGRSPFTSANATVIGGSGRGSPTIGPVISSTGPPVSRQARQRPAPSPAVTSFPGASRSTRPRWCSSPSSREGTSRSATNAWARAVTGVTSRPPAGLASMCAT
jgi:hypothetical protein